MKIMVLPAIHGMKNPLKLKPNVDLKMNTSGLLLPIQRLFKLLQLLKDPTNSYFSGFSIILQNFKTEANFVNSSNSSVNNHKQIKKILHAHFMKQLKSRYISPQDSANLLG